MDNVIFHNPRCSKSRETLALVEKRGVTLEVVEYLKTPPDAATIKDFCAKLKLRPYDLVRRKGKEYDAMVNALASFGPDDDDRWSMVLARYPVLMERPVVLHKGKAALGRPPENVLKIL